VTHFFVEIVNNNSSGSSSINNTITTNNKILMEIFRIEIYYAITVY
jgi:hypothetical protein